MPYSVLERFLRYVQIDTQADPTSTSVPSTAKQLNLSKILLEELQHMGVQAEMTEHGYIYAEIPANVTHEVPNIFFCAHVDTAPDCSGTDVKPIVHTNYQGQDIILPEDPSQIISPAQYPYLLQKKGDDIVTASGLTLLGSDDKSGVAIIMDALYQLVNDPSIPHGVVKALFTTDEEIGRGVAHVDIQKLNCAFGYTLDGGALGDLENENFSADYAVLTIHGVSAHPCCAKGKMENAIKIASQIVDALPKESLSPETTEGKEGFIHPTKMEGRLETAKVEFLLRDFETEKLKDHADLLRSIAAEVLQAYPHSSFDLEVKAQYRNMKDVLDQHPHVVDIAVQAMQRIGLSPTPDSIRGGTDGAALSHKGLPCPNLFAGEQAIHSKHEWVSVQDMQKAVDTVLEICKIVSGK